MGYTVSEAAEVMGVAPSAIRYYDKEGLLPFVKRSESGVRFFSESDLGWLRTISCLKATGMPLKEIRRYVEWAMEGDNTIDERLQLIYEQRERLQRQMEELQKTMDFVEYKCWYYETAKQAGSETALQHMTLAQIPEQHHGIVEEQELYRQQGFKK